MDNLLNIIEDIKENINSEQYKSLLDNLGAVKKENDASKEIVITVSWAVIDVVEKESGVLCYYPRTVQVTFTQKGFEDIGEYGTYKWHEFYHKLSPENREIFNELSNLRPILEENSAIVANISQDHNTVSIIGFGSK